MSLVHAFARFARPKAFLKRPSLRSAGCTRTYVGGIERGERNPSLKNIAALAAALGVSPASFFDWWKAR